MYPASSCGFPVGDSFSVCVQYSCREGGRGAVWPCACVFLGARVYDRVCCVRVGVGERNRMACSSCPGCVLRRIGSECHEEVKILRS